MGDNEISIEEIRRLNDLFRKGESTGGRIVVTRSIQALGPERLESILKAVREFEDFSEDNDPYREHDFGSLTVEDTRVLWKIDYYDLGVSCASPNPADPSVTTRVLTIMRPEDY